MTFLNGAADEGEPGHSGHDEVVIRIRGRTAARMLGRGDAEKRILTELAGVKQRLDSMEATAAERATQYEALSQTVEGLQQKVAHLSGQVADHVTELRTELARLRNDYDAHAVRAAQMPGQVERVQMQVDYLQRQVGPVSGQITELQTDLLNLERRFSPAAALPSGHDAGTLSDAAPNTRPVSIWDRAAARTSWLKQRLNFW